MRRHLLFATILAAAFSVGASAQSGTGQAGQAGQAGTMAQGAPGAEKQAKDQNVTVTGCIENGTQSPSTPAGTSGSTTPAGSAASSSSADQFVLSSITGAPASITGIDRLSLSGKDSDLKKHVGHKVEITGKLENPSSPSSMAGAPPSTAGTSGSTETLKVSSVKMIAESCSVQ
jgi:hypothetical protein